MIDSAPQQTKHVRQGLNYKMELVGRGIMLRTANCWQGFAFAILEAIFALSLPGTPESGE